MMAGMCQPVGLAEFFYKEFTNSVKKNFWCTEAISFFVKTPQADNLSFIRSEDLKAECSKVTVH
jgi:hypothetical protein